MAIIYNAGMSYIPLFNDTDFWFMLVSTDYSPDKDDGFVSNITAFELSDLTYTRVNPSGSYTAVDDTLDVFRIGCDDVEWTALESNFETVGYAVLFYFVTEDADSPMVAAWEITEQPDGSDAFLLVDPARGLIELSQGA